jgi:peptidylprolyl isomerase
MRLPNSIALALAMSSVGCVLHRHAGLPAPIPPVSGDAHVAFALRETDVTLGAGASAEPRKCLFVHYTGWLTNGTKFDSSRDTMPNGAPRPPLSFPQGFRRVIAGWDLGFEGMRVGGRRRLFIPYQLAYGEAGRPPIPPKAELIFDVELMAVADTVAERRPQNSTAPRCPPWTQVSPK